MRIRLILSQPEAHSSYSVACWTNASRLSCSDGMPPESAISVRQVIRGSRLTSVAARSADSSAARYHSSSTSTIARSGRPATNGSRIPCESAIRMRSAVM